MGAFRKSIHIDAPVERVYTYLTEPEHLPEIWPSMVEVTNAKHDPSGKHSFDWVYKMAGIRFKGHSDTVEAEKNKHVVVKNEGISSTFDWTYEAEDGGTTVTMQVEYEAPRSLLGKLSERLVDRINEHEAEAVLTNLKDRMELGPEGRR